MEEPKNITNDSRFNFPVPGVKFLHRGQEIDLRAITETKAMQLAAEEQCKFIALKAPQEKSPTSGASASPSSTSSSSKGDK
jgi:hypothetical protein